MAVCNLNFISLWDIFKIYNDSKRSLHKDINKNIDGYDIRFRSREYSSNQPYLEVTYTLTMKKYYYIKDHLGSIRSVINESGIVVESNDYYPFGLKMPGRSYVSGTPSRNLFTGKERDDETGWDYFGARYYDPAIGRFLTPDPVSQVAPHITPYQYCMNSPVNLIDPIGLYPFEPKYYLNGIEIPSEFINQFYDIVAIQKEWKYNEDESIKYDEYTDISKGINELWEKSNSGANQKDVKETAGYILIDLAGNISIVVLDNTGNTWNNSNNIFKLAQKGKLKHGMFDNKMILAQVHSHPKAKDVPVSGNLEMDRPDRQLAGKINAPVFAIGSNGIAYTLGGKEQRLDKTTYQNLINGNSKGFREFILDNKANKRKLEYYNIKVK